MFDLRCTVRNCPETLVPHDRTLRCAAGHAFDQAREGYWSLLQPQDRKSTKPGDADQAVLARHRWLNRGLGQGLIDAVRPWLEDHPGRTMDLGCGEGTFGVALFADDPADFCGVDLSRRALKLAARRWPEATWVLANADRFLPAADRSVQRVVSMFGRRPAREIGRVIASGGLCIVALPGEDDLVELREQVQGSADRRSRWEPALEELAPAELRLIDRRVWRSRVDLDAESMEDALAMTYRGQRRGDLNRRAALKPMTVTLSADLLLLRKFD